MKLIALDDGHGMETAGKRTPSIAELNNRVIKENEFNRSVVAYLDKELKELKSELQDINHVDKVIFSI